jgi:hypothetical protein
MALDMTQNFISVASSVHRNKFDYRLVTYINAKTKVNIICPIHGQFSQLPNEHLKGTSCYKCGILSRTKKKTYNTKKFIDLATEKFGDTYDYKLVTYTKSKEKVIIICREHGPFTQIPNSHLNGRGCPKCRGHKITATKINKYAKNFIKKANLVHKNLYDYTLVVYKGYKKKVKIICKKHGLFEQTPNAHITQQQGCPICKLSKGEIIVENSLKMLNILYKTQVRFFDCRNKIPLPFDFGIYDSNEKLLGLIEYQGSQHYNKQSIFGMEQGFSYRKHNDKIKKTFCVKNNIPLLEIPYWKKDKIQSLVKNFIDQTIA